MIFFSFFHERGTKKKFFLCPTLVISLLSSKLIISLITIYKHYAIDIADPGSMQDACDMNFVTDSLTRSVVEHRSAESEGLRFDSSCGLRIFSQSHARDKMKKHHSLQITSFKIVTFLFLLSQ